MPELPEVESLLRSLQPVLIGEVITHIRVLEPKIIASRGNIRRASSQKTHEFIKGLRGETISSLARRGKNLVIYCKSGKLLLVHLKMTGQLVVSGNMNHESGNTLPNNHTRIIFRLKDKYLFYNDARKFGYVLYFPNKEALVRSGHFEKLGIDPLEDDFSPESFGNKLKIKRGYLKHALMGQTLVAGLGNIYCDEVCFRAGLLPDRKIESLSDAEIKKLHDAIKSVLASAVAAKGSSVSSYVLTDGAKGSFVKKHKVYGRSGKPCLSCKTLLTKMTFVGRTTVFCKECQK